MDKRRLREELRRQRQSLLANEVESLSSKILEGLWEILDLSSISSLHSYLPLKSQNEVNTRPLLLYIWQNYPLVKTAAWDSHSQDARAIWMDSTGTTTRVPGNFRFDVLIVPVLGFDKNNHRLGFGGGFYDRFLAGQPKARKIGLAFEIGFITSNFPAEAHDVKLDMIITERKVYRA